MVFEIFRRRRNSETNATSDITETMVSTFDALKAADRNPDKLPRHFEMNSGSAAMIGALRDTYPGLPIDDDGPGMELIKTTASNKIFDAVTLSDALFDLVRHCPEVTKAKMNVMIFIVSPGSIPANDRRALVCLGTSDLGLGCAEMAA